MARRIALLSVVTLLLSCNQPREPTELAPDEEARIAQEVDAAVRGYIDALRSLDEGRMLAFWADVEGFAMAGDGKLLVGYEPWADHIRERVKSTAAVNHIKISDPQIYVLAANAASYSMQFEWTMTSNDGQVTNASGSWTYVLKRFPEGWRVVHSAGTHIYP